MKEYLLLFHVLKEIPESLILRILSNLFDDVITFPQFIFAISIICRHAIFHVLCHTGNCEMLHAFKL